MPKGIWGDRRPSKQVPCAHCGKPFRFYHSNPRKCCSLECRDALRRVDFAPTGRQQAILIGSLLGDASLVRGGTAKEYCFTKAQKRDHLEYVKWHGRELLPMPSRIATRIMRREWKGEIRSHPSCLLETYHHPVFTVLREQWYPGGVKRVPDGVRLDALSLAIWFCDDGCNTPTGRKAWFSTHAFTARCAEKLRAELDRMGFRSSICWVGNQKNQPTVRISSYDYEAFIATIRPHIPWRCMAHKISLDGFARARELSLHPEITDDMLLEARHDLGSWSKAAKSLGLKVGAAIARVHKRGLHRKYAERYGENIFRLRSIITDEELVAAYRKYGNWRAAAPHLGVHEGTLYRLAKDRDILARFAG